MESSSEIPGLETLLDQFDENPRPAVELLRRLATSAPGSLRALLLQLMRSRQSESGMRYLGLLAANDEEFLASLCDPAALSLREACAIVGRILTYQPKADLRLLEAQKRWAPEDEYALRAMSILDETSEGSRLLHLLAPALKSANPRLQSKAARFIGRRTRSLAMAERAFEESSSRVRANAIEAIAADGSPEARSLFWRAAQDPHNRVRGNALLTLYRHGETKSISLIRDMAAHPEPPHRITAAWIIGETGSQRFSGVLLSMIRDDNPNVRAAALKAMRRLKDSNALARASALTLATVGEARGRRIRVTGWDDLGAPLCGVSPTAFTIIEANTPQYDYQVAENWNRSPLSAAFLVASRPVHAEWLTTSLTALRNALPAKRTQDKWAVVAFTSASGESLSAQDLPLIFHSQEHLAAGMLERPPLRVAEELDIAWPAALRRLIPAASTPSGASRIFCLAVDDWPHPGVESLGQLAARGGVSIDSIVCPGSRVDPWDRLAKLTGGNMIRAEGLGNISEAWRTLLSAAVSHYEITWQAAGSQTAGSVRVTLDSSCGAMEFGPEPVEVPLQVNAVVPPTDAVARDEGFFAPRFDLLK